MRLQNGARLGPYEITGCLGVGPMAEVYSAWDSRVRRTVAVKILAPDALDNPRRTMRFEAEAQALAQLTHPNICTFFDKGEDAGIVFLLMEHLQGETLAHRLLRGALPLKEALQAAVQLADALDTAHRQGITHRDLKPANVMLTPSGVKILDFGLAKWTHDPSTGDSGRSVGEAVAATITQPDGRVGTLAYMPPEQFDGHPDARSDLFALCAVVFEMVTGRRAFDGATDSEVIAAIVSRDTPSMIAFEPLMPPALDWAVQKGLAKDPLKRWQTASDLRDLLQRIAQPWPSAPRPVSAPVPPPPAKHRWIGVAAIALVSLAAVTAFLRWSPALSQAPTTSFQVLPPRDAIDLQQPTISPDGRSLAFIAQMKDGKSSLWIRPLDSIEAYPIADADQLAFPFWSPDSQSMAFFNDGQLKRVAAVGGPVQAICEAPYAHGGAWSPAGVIVFSPSADTALSKVAAGGGTPTAVTVLSQSPTERSHRYPEFLADGNRFIYTVYFDDPARRPLVQVGSLEVASARTVVETSISRSLSASGYLFFNRDLTGPTLAQRFDEASLRLQGEPVPVVDRVETGPLDGVAGFSVSRNDVMAYQAARSHSTPQLTWFGRHGRQQGVVGQGIDSGMLESDWFSLSADGMRVAGVVTDTHTHRADVWVMDTMHSVTRRATVDGTVVEPRWSPNGERIAFVSHRRGPRNGDVYATSVRGDGPDEPLLVSETRTNLWDWSSDGAFLLFGRQEGPKGISNLWTLALGGNGVPTRYLSSEFHKGEARFSPDTRWVAYESNESGREEIYVQSFPDPAIRYQVSNPGGASPRWRADGKELFYLAPDARMMAVSVKGTAALDIGTPVALFSVSPSTVAAEANFEVAPDGQRFLIAEMAGEPARSPITVVLNWRPNLKK